ncbi:hypothetical protein RM780_25210 [Streptomyces sp. DSM 44917]|uniref:Uncharacterized protein n=1 Tax=Streptomyces boetiae TaxID=3075541 RepID=A0ABU2LFF3_9ACTN|nr:hypothetical protein [Streptomyces sp. DSM 44917]MDT0310226.1 hypothetical protein [Streptomyces sp. DSM 44917]
MPRGRYTTPEGQERFQCAPGPTGWRYVSETVGPDGAPTGSLDLTLDALGRPVRLHLRTADWQVRGGTLDGLSWVRMAADGADAREGNAPAHAFAGTSPAFLVAMAHLLRLSAPGASARLRLADFAPPALAPRTREEGWTLAGRETHHAEDGRTLAVDTYHVDDLETGERRTLHLSGDVILAAPGIELEELDTPPSTLRTAE